MRKAESFLSDIGSACLSVWLSLPIWPAMHFLGTNTFGLPNGWIRIEIARGTQYHKYMIVINERGRIERGWSSSWLSGSSPDAAGLMERTVVTILHTLRGQIPTWVILRLENALKLLREDDLAYQAMHEKLPEAEKARYIDDLIECIGGSRP